MLASGLNLKPGQSPSPGPTPWSTVIVCCLAVSVVACDSDVSPPVSVERFTVTGSSELATVPVRIRSAEALFFQLEAEAPGFAGLYVDRETGELVIRATTSDASARAAIRARVHDRLVAIGSAHAGRSNRVRDATFTFSQLARFRDIVVEAAHRADLGIASVDADEENNTVTVGLSDPAAEASVRLALAQAGVPAGAMRFVEFSDVEFTVDTRPAAPTPRTILSATVMGGIRITLASGSCTLGLVTQSNGTPVAITNSHCSALPFTSFGDGTIYRAGPDTLGIESSDRGYDDLCHFVVNCRRSDSNLISQGPFTATTWVQHQIVWRPNLNTVGAIDDSFYNQIDPSAPLTVGAVNLPSSGETVYKTGQRSGRTSGYVTGTCIDIWKGFNLMFECQNEATYFSFYGDSGSPVYAMWLHPNANLKGISWGKNGQGRSLFSSFHSVNQDFGSTLTSLPWGWPGGGGGGGGGCGEEEGGPGDIDPC